MKRTTSQVFSGAPHGGGHRHPDYVNDMARLLEQLWSDDKKTADEMRLRLTTEPNKVLAEYNLRGVHSKTIAVVHFEERDIFHLPIPVKPEKKEEREGDALIALASHLIRCCMDGC